jgi:hypothetical protein
MIEHLVQVRDQRKQRNWSKGKAEVLFADLEN